MSDDWIALIPEEPTFVPRTERQLAARQRFCDLAPDAQEIDVKVFETVQFFDCGVNFERLLCPECGSQISIEWWLERLDEDLSEGFKLSSYGTPCCGSSYTLHDLNHEWPQGFGRFRLRARNANIGRLTEDAKHELEEILETKLRVIYQHL
jgi:hypothetical protein